MKANKLLSLISALVMVVSVTLTSVTFVSPTVSATEGASIISVTTGDGSLAFTENYQALNLLLAQDAQAGGENDIKLDYTFNISTADLKKAYDADPDNENWSLGEDQAHKRYFYYDFYLSVEGSAFSKSENRRLPQQSLYSSGFASEFAYKDLSTNPDLVSPSYKNWSDLYYNDLDFLTFNGGSSGASFRINATVADIKDCLLKLKPDYSDITIDYIYFSVYVGWEASGPNWQGGGRGSYDGKSVVIYDNHEKDVYYELPWTTTIDREYKAEYGVHPILFEKGLTQEDFLSPISVKYIWNYYLSHQGFFEILDEDGNYIGSEEVGAPWGYEGDLYSVYRHADGKTYGVCMGSVEKTEPTFRIREIINAENRALIMGMVGVAPMGVSNGNVHMGISCDVEFTYEDGVTYFMKSPAGMDEMMRLVAPCVHTCTICGQCTAVESLSCNSDRYNPNMRTSECTCETPTVALNVESVPTDNITVNEAVYNVSIDKIQPTTDSSEGTFLEVVENIIPDGNVQVVYNVNVVNDYGESFNGWGQNCATVTFVISNETATGLENGNLEVVHIDPKTNKQEVFVPSTDDTAGTHGTYTLAQDGESTTISVTSNSFSPIVIVEPAAHSHIWSKAWSNNETYHWHMCEAEGCDLTDVSKMAGYGRHACIEGESHCVLCGYGVASSISLSDSFVSATNGTGESAVLVVASYSSSNKLVGIKVKVIEAHKNSGYSYEELGLNTSGADVVKAMLFKDMLSLKPLVECQLSNIGA